MQFIQTEATWRGASSCPGRTSGPWHSLLGLSAYLGLRHPAPEAPPLIRPEQLFLFPPGERAASSHWERHRCLWLNTCSPVIVSSWRIPRVSCSKYLIWKKFKSMRSPGEGNWAGRRVLRWESGVTQCYWDKTDGINYPKHWRLPVSP